MELKGQYVEESISNDSEEEMEEEKPETEQKYSVQKQTYSHEVE